MNEKDRPHSRPHNHSHPSPASPEGEAHKDPVCGMRVKETTPHTYEYGGRRYFFCGARCREKFRAEPEKYLQPAHSHSTLNIPAHTAQSRSAGAAYTCPMHPKVRQAGPGTCPACGMALEPLLEAAPATRTEYTCPMHPEIVRPEPGS